jgi:lipopolysaccharide/colanic/teichoic acid biosynthesis glycosyltransferase
VEKLRYELYYIKNQSLFMDAKIIMKTVRVILTGQGT